MKRIFALLLSALLLTVISSAAAPDGLDTVIDPSKMATENQATQAADFKFEIVDDNGEAAIKMNLDGSDGWGWLVFDEYDTATEWSGYNTALLKIKNPGSEDILFGFNGMTESGPRIEFNVSDITALTAAGEDVSSKISSLSRDGTNDVDWGSGDPYFTIPAGFDGYMLFPFDKAFRDDGFDITDINSMAAFLNGDSAYSGYVLVDYIAMYDGSAADLRNMLFPVQLEIVEEAPAAEEKAETQTVTAAPQTSDALAALALISAASASALVIAKKKNKK